jgi:NADH-quinone oxidoreductase subunit H
METFLIYLIFPGFIFTAALGMMARWLDRKVTARLQWRVGPPWYQSFADIVKLLGKQTIVPPECRKTAFLLAPVLGISGMIAASGVLGAVSLNPARGFRGDLIAVIFLLAVPSLALFIGGLASRNPLASIGASREMKLMAAYGIPFILAAFTPAAKAGLTVALGDILACQHVRGDLLWSPSGILAFIVGLVCMQARLGFVPFDSPEAETEIEAGALTEYSGTVLAIFTLMKMMLVVIVPWFLLILFAGGVQFQGWGIARSMLRYLLILIIAILVRNTNPRIRIDQALRFFRGPVTVVAAAGVVLALLGY